MWIFFQTLFVGIFQFLFGWLRGALPLIATFFGTSVIQLLIGLGWSVTSFTGFNALTGYLIDYAVTGFDGLSSDIIQLLGLMWFDKAINLMLSSAVGLMTIKGLKAGTLTRGSWRSGAGGA